MSYSPEDVVGTNLFAASSVPIKSLPLDNATTLGYFQRGDFVGKVYSFLLPKPGRTTLYWMFYDKNGKAYYTPQKKGLYSENSLRNQGVLTDKEKEEASQPQWYRLGKKLLIGTVTTYGVFSVASALINRK